MYHYAGNNPVRYTDPNGLASVSNDTGDLILVKPESKYEPFVFLQQNDKYEGNIDGIIFADGTVFKTFGRSDYVATKNKNGEYVVKYGEILDFSGNCLKALQNSFTAELELKGVDIDSIGLRIEDMYKTYHYGIDSDDFLYSWIGLPQHLDIDNNNEKDLLSIPILLSPDKSLPLTKETLKRWNRIINRGSNK